MSLTIAAGRWHRLGVPLALGAVFAAPLVAALLVYGRPEWQPSETLVHGVLMRPVEPLSLPPLRGPAGKPLDKTLFLGRWSLLYLSDGRCDSACMQLMDRLKRICRARAKGPGRLQRVLVARSLPETTAKRLAETDAGLRLALISDDWTLPPGQVYLIDPLGNLVLRYPPGFAPEGLGSDLARLLRLSGIG